MEVSSELLGGEVARHLVRGATRGTQVVSGAAPARAHGRTGHECRTVPGVVTALYGPWARIGRREPKAVTRGGPGGSLCRPSTVPLPPLHGAAGGLGEIAGREPSGLVAGVRPRRAPCRQNCRVRLRLTVMAGGTRAMARTAEPGGGPRS
jgi:hypothetical protein